ncbi:MerR family transcriptional regulator [Pseudooceanicola sediminis]|uniref:MerR family transcriptional regulator n=1 Tax=Pseudooceanicola sediminis TaxID=2211117 RepID=A0A399J398_9RHOB|nr:helix-turn-helix domain-containing protein [Pseudooceanicola sediminis]KAA2317507.1 helix-turn-helix domain-containing protein [Puniceibacterium sp. HSS470]RII39785.1 MerR family transcriptional regulator [Pseudooceanicola sediminis]|tara:strand:- start:3422 stop:3826 length:405 start_codon:yes stop_codon:yes gene_type:complete
MKFLDIREVCEKSGFTASALRYYEDAGLVQSVARRGLRRQYEPSTLKQLALIAMGRRAGFSLRDIRQILNKNGSPGLPRDTLHAKADELDAQIAELSALRDTLRHVADCPARSHFACERFQTLMRYAQRDVARH